MPESKGKLIRVKSWLSLAMLLPVLGSMIEAVFMWAPDLKLENWYDQTNLGKEDLMTALVITALEVLPAILLYYTFHHIENGWRTPATLCAVSMLICLTGGAVLWNDYIPLVFTWYSAAMIAIRAAAGILTVLYAVRLSEKRDRTLSRTVLLLFVAGVFIRTAVLLAEAGGITDDVLLTQRLVHGFAYVIMNLFLGLAHYVGFLPSDRPDIIGKRS